MLLNDNAKTERPGLRYFVILFEPCPVIEHHPQKMSSNVSCGSVSAALVKDRCTRVAEIVTQLLLD